jgi:hypothetical protein
MQFWQGPDKAQQNMGECAVKMFEYHAWMVIHSSPGDEEYEDLQAAFDAAERELQPIRKGTTAISLRWVNGMAQLQMSGFLNHRSGEGQRVIEAFQRIGELAPGSYGVLFARDDEDPGGRQNEFQVLVMRRGSSLTVADGFLSPYIPVVEDEPSSGRRDAHEHGGRGSRDRRGSGSG